MCAKRFWASCQITDWYPDTVGHFSLLEFLGSKKVGTDHHWPPHTESACTESAKMGPWLAAEFQLSWEKNTLGTIMQSKTHWFVTRIGNYHNFGSMMCGPLSLKFDPDLQCRLAEYACWVLLSFLPNHWLIPWDFEIFDYLSFWALSPIGIRQEA